MDVADLFDDWARRGRAEGMEAGHGQTAGPLLAALEVRPGMHFLDLGCGNGWAARFAAAKGAHAVGIDASPEMVQRATFVASKHELDAEFHVGDFARLPFDDDHFDIAWSMEAVYYAPDPDAVLAEVRRVVRPGGAFHLLIDHYAENTASHTWPEDTGVPMVLRSQDQWVESFRRAGFSHVEAHRLRAEQGDAWKREQGTLHVQGTV